MCKTPIRMERDALRYTCHQLRDAGVRALDSPYKTLISERKNQVTQGLKVT